MTEQTEQQTPAPQPAVEDAVDWRARREEQDHKMLESQRKNSEISAAWSSREAAAVNAMIREDGNVEWRHFVSHVGGIMAVLELVGEDGKPDTRRIIPLVDELFHESYGGKGQEYAGGMVMRRGPRNRPYPHRPLSVQQSGGEPTQADAERMLKDLEADADRPRLTSRR